MSKVWRYITKNKTVCVLNIVLFIILLVPYSYIYSHHNENEDLHWIPNFVFQQADLFGFYLLIAVLIIGFQIAKTNILRKRLLIISLIVSFVYFIAGSLSLYLPVQDFSAGIGNVLVLTIFQLGMLILILEQ